MPSRRGLAVRDQCVEHAEGMRTGTPAFGARVLKKVRLPEPTLARAALHQACEEPRTRELPRRGKFGLPRRVAVHLIGSEMVKRDDNHEYIKIGQKNQALIPQLKQWCRHINVQIEISGLLAEMTQLPIGMLRVECPHGVTQSMSMHLEYEAELFIVRNCSGCAHHQEVSSENLGRTILAKRLRLQQEAAAAERRRLELERQTQQDVASTLNTKEMTQASVNRLILRLYAAPDAPETVPNLVDAANLAPEFFSDEAIKVLADGFPTPMGAACVRIVRTVLAGRKRLPDFIPGAIVKAVLAGVDEACSVIVEHVADFEHETLMRALTAAIAIPNYDRVPTASEAAKIMTAAIDIPDPKPVPKASYFWTRPTFPGTAAFVSSTLDAMPEEALRVLGRQLGIDSKRTKLNCANLLLDLLPDAAKHIVQLTRLLVRSFELEDDRYGDSADAMVSELLAHLYAFAPQYVAEDLERTYAVATGEVRQLVLETYANVVLFGTKRSYSRSSPVFPQEAYAVHAPVVVDKLYLAVADLQNDLRTRNRACELLERVIDAYPADGAPRLHRLLTRLTLTARESKVTPKEDGHPLADIENYSRESAYDAMENRVVRIVERIASHSPAPAYRAVVGAIHETDSKEDPGLKSKLVRTLALFGKQYAIAPFVVPELYKHLTDFESRLVRQSAIAVVGELLQERPHFSVPEDMLELILAYLEEDWVVIHKACVRTLARCRFPNDDDRSRKVLRRILALEHMYSTAKDLDTYSLQDILTVLEGAFGSWPNVQTHVAMILLPKYGASSERHFAEDMLVSLVRRLESYPAARQAFLSSALKFLERFPADRYNTSLMSDRARILEALFDLPSHLVSEASKLVGDIALARVGFDCMEAVTLIGLLSYHGLHAEAMRTAEDCARKLPRVRTHEAELELYELAARAERAQVMRVTHK